MAIDRATETIVVGATDAVYVFTCQGSQFVQTQKLTASDGANGFGESVTIDGDTIVVGAPGDTNENGDNAGAAYVYIRTSASSTSLAASDSGTD